MATAKVYNVKGEVIKDLTLAPAVFGVTVKPSVIQQVVVAMEANGRQVLAHTKMRGEVRGGGKKPWKQKGTGRARAGSTRSPLWIGGGVTFGPRNDRNFTKKINKKMRQTALRMVLSDRVKSESFKVIDTFGLTGIKTKNVASALKKLSMWKSVLLVSEGTDKNLVLSSQNLPKVVVTAARNLNVLDVVKHKYMVVAESAVPVIEKLLMVSPAKKAAK